MAHGLHWLLYERLIDIKSGGFHRVAALIFGGKMKDFIAMILMGIFLVVFSANAEEGKILEENELFTALETGSYLHVVPKRLKGPLLRKDGSDGMYGNSRKPSCYRIERRLRRISKWVDHCLESPNDEICEYYREIAAELMDPYPNDIGAKSLEQYLAIESGTQSLGDAERLGRTLAKKYGKDENKIAVLEELTLSGSARLKDPKLAVPRNSWTAKVAQLLNQNPQDWIKAFEKDDLILVENNILFCDIENRVTGIEVSFSHEIAQADQFPEHKLLAAWSVFQKLRSDQSLRPGNTNHDAMFFAAKIGRAIAQSQSAQTTGIAELSFERIYYDFFEDGHSTRQLKSYTKKEQMRSELYPDVFYSHFLDLTLAAE